MQRMGDAAARAMAAYDVAVLDAGAVVDGWANGTIDNWHFDGGVLRGFHNGPHEEGLRTQPVSLNLLNLMLNALDRPCTRVHHGEGMGELCGGVGRERRADL